MLRNYVPRRLDYLDLDSGQRNVVSNEMKISRLIHSLKDNYYAYGIMVASKENERAIRDQKDFYAGFFALPRVPLPKMKANSDFLIWQSFVQKIFNFFDGDNRDNFISELQQLENTLCRLNKKSGRLHTPEELLEQILLEFEQESGFSSVIHIKPSDGVGGILSPGEFKKLLAAGHPINDLGTTFQLEQHGKLSHRLQFYILGKYFVKNIYDFFSSKDFDDLISALTIKYPEMVDVKNKFPANKIISIFYKMLGSDEFNNSFNWKAFVEERNKLNLYFNKQAVPSVLNMGNIWVQLFDRYGYAGYFSVPSTFGFLQKLGCFLSLPTIGEPKTKTNKHLKAILDITLPFFSSMDRKALKHEKIVDIPDVKHEQLQVKMSK
jgi:hypothetical protein